MNEMKVNHVGRRSDVEASASDICETVVTKRESGKKAPSICRPVFVPTS
jgi:hypothetical protein